MNREVEQFIGRSHLNDASVMDNRNAVRKVTDNRKVMRDKHVGKAALFLELVHQVEHLRTDRYIQRGDRFIGDDEFRLHNHCPGNPDTLALAA